MASTWGSSTWGNNSWQSDNNLITPSSNTLSLTVSSVSAFSYTGWGSQSWSDGSWGDLSDVVVIEDGNQATLSLNSVTADGTIQIGWGGLAWGEGEWGDLANPNIDVTGIQTTSIINSVTVTANAEVDVTTNLLTLTQGDETAGTSALVELSGISVTSSVTSAFAGELVVVEVTSPVNDEWGTEYWGAGQWGLGDGVTVLVGTDTVHIGDANVDVTSVSATGQTGTLGQNTIYEFTSATATASVNDVFGGELVEVQVTTASATQWGNAPFGEGQWGQGVGTDISQGGEEVAVPSVEVDVTGIATTTNIESVVITADANTVQTGEQLTVTLGDEDAVPNTKASPTGIALSIAQNNVLAGISVLVEPTGSTMTSSTGIIGLNAWELVDSGTAPTWTVVDKAA